MLFSSIPFLYYFLPIVLVIYFIVPKIFKNTVLLIASLVFYGWGEPKYVFLMLITVLVNYILGLLIEKNSENKVLKKVFMGISAVFCLGALGYFKYADFFIVNFNRITGLSFNTLNIVLPIGISFYTFQILSYTIDVYRGNVKAQKNPVNLATYIALFPQLIAGPIVRYCDIEVQLTQRSHTLTNIAEGIRRFTYGLSKKIIIANTLGELCKTFLSSDEKSVLFYWIFAISYSLQIYFDFSGYSDMAIGLGKIFGFHFMENFNYPFISRSVTEFWRRWHISLGTWFRDYVYIPMGGNRVSKVRLFINIFTVWFLTGFWHGAEWNFIIWGLYFAVLLVIEKFFISDFLKKHKIVSHIYLIIAVLFSFAFFAASNLGEAGTHITGMLGLNNLPFITRDFIYNFRSFFGTLVLAILCATPVFSKIKAFIQTKKVLHKISDVLEILFILVLIIVCTAYLVDGSFNPFLYFRF